MTKSNSIRSADTERSDTWAIVPVKALDLAKQRLRDALSDQERQGLAAAMLSDVLAATSQATRLAGFVVVSQDVTAIKLGRQFGARVLMMHRDTGLSRAVTAAARLLAAEGVERILTIPSDVPLINSAEVDAICDSLVGSPSITLVPNRDDSGTNCVAVSPPNAMSFAFGPGSFQRHCLSAKHDDLDARVLRLQGFGLDIDVPDDLLAFLDIDNATTTREYLQSSGIAARIIAQSTNEYRQDPRHIYVQEVV